MKNVIIWTAALLLALAGTASAQVPPCAVLAEVGGMVSKDKADGMPLGFVQNYYLAQMAEYPADERAAVLGVIRAVYRLDKSREEVHAEILQRCKAGEFGPATP